MVKRMRVCAPGYIGPANIEVVMASDYDAVVAELEALKAKHTTVSITPTVLLDQQPLGYEFERVLADNLSNLYLT